MKQYQVFARLPGEPWAYFETYDSPSKALMVSNLIRARLMIAKVVIVPAAGQIVGAQHG